MQPPSTLIEIKMWHGKNEKNILTYDHTVHISLVQMKRCNMYKNNQQGTTENTL